MAPQSAADLTRLAHLPDPVIVCLGIALLAVHLVPILVRATAAFVALFSRSRERANRALKVLDATAVRRRRVGRGDDV
jgi:hypothetical protein